MIGAGSSTDWIFCSQRAPLLHASLEVHALATGQCFRGVAQRYPLHWGGDSTGFGLIPVVSRAVGASENLHAVPEGTNLGCGCGNPIEFAESRIGEALP